MNKGGEPESKARRCLCPYCEEDLGESEPLFCKPCGVVLRYCAICKVVVGKDAAVCPQCGGKVE